MSYEHLIYEKPEPGIARIWLNRPEARNAQNSKMLYELNEAFNAAVHDDDVKVIILAAKGPHFSSGHDLMESNESKVASIEQHGLVGSWSASDVEGSEAMYCYEKEIYEGLCKRWRDLSKPTIASVQGKAIAGGMMLIWPCDFVIAAEGASFQDNTVYMGIPGVEYFAHTFELGPKKAKEFLMTGQPLTAEQACKAGMVNRVVPDEELEEATLQFARSIADKPSFALKLVKDIVNAAVDAQGYPAIQRIAFNAHELAHTHYRLKSGVAIDPDFMSNFMTKKR